MNRREEMIETGTIEVEPYYWLINSYLSNCKYLDAQRICLAYIVNVQIHTKNNIAVDGNSQIALFEKKLADISSLLINS
jgi:hypothetical protein